MTEPLRCYRHPNRETYVSCSECGRGICPDCMVYGPVGIRCPEHARGKGVAPRQRARIQARRISVPVGLVTRVLIGVNVAVYLLELALGGQFNGTGNSLYEHGALYGPLVADGDWWRLITAAFLHYGPIHLGLNMIVLWYIGPAIEEFFGRWRYGLLYLVSGLAGSAGALIQTPGPTVGASGAIWGLMAAAVLLEWRGINILGGQAMGLLVMNLLFTFVFGLGVGAISIGGHIGGGIGGAAAAFTFLTFRRMPAVATLSVAAIGVVAVAVALLQA